MIKDALPTAGPIVKWLADPNAPDLDPNTITDDDKLRFQKFASLFIGQFPETKEEIEKYLSQPAKLKAIQDRAVERPGMVVDFIANMPVDQIEKLLTDHPKIIEQIKAGVVQVSPQLSLARVFNTGAAASNTDLQAVFSSTLPELEKGLLTPDSQIAKGLDTSAEIGEFFSYLPRQYVDGFVQKFKDKTGVEISIAEDATPEDIKKAITEGVTTAHSSWRHISGWQHDEASMAAEIRASIQDTIHDLKSGKGLDTKSTANIIHNMSQSADGKKVILGIIAPGDPPKLKDDYRDLITPQLLANADKSLIHGALSDGIVSGLNEIKNFIRQLPPEFQKIIAPILEIAGNMIENISPMADQLEKTVASMPSIPGMGATG